MKQQRLDGLADGIFAIAMTLLAFDLRVPAISNPLDFQALFVALSTITPLLLSLVLSFALLFTYWRAHHFLASVYARNLTVGLADYNAMFFLFITLVPFSARLLGRYSENITAITVYGLNVICIGVTLLFMRYYIEH
ncbi:MAG: TMEM175 family protein, partial [Candidatus Pacebacteria bacterium]|nr:TMEM175 family protein [Candidatus Paceibacterota bacterium]